MLNEDHKSFSTSSKNNLNHIDPSPNFSACLRSHDSPWYATFWYIYIYSLIIDLDHASCSIQYYRWMYLVIHSLLGLFLSFLYVWIPWLLCCCEHKWSNWSWSTWQTSKNTMRQSLVITQLSTSLLNIYGWMIEVCETVHRHTHTRTQMDIRTSAETTWFFMHNALFSFSSELAALCWPELN